MLKTIRIATANGMRLTLAFVVALILPYIVELECAVILVAGFRLALGTTLSKILLCYTHAAFALFIFGTD